MQKPSEENSDRKKFLFFPFSSDLWFFQVYPKYTRSQNLGWISQC